MTLILAALLVAVFVGCVVQAARERRATVDAELADRLGRMRYRDEHGLGDVLTDGVADGRE